MVLTDYETPYRGGFVGSEHRFALTVYFEDTDTAGVVYYAKHLFSCCYLIFPRI